VDFPLRSSRAAARRKVCGSADAPLSFGDDLLYAAGLRYNF